MVGSTTISASSVYVEFGYEETFGGGSTELPLLFGKDQKATGLEYNVNQLPLGQLYSPEIDDDFVYLKNEGKVSMDYILSHPWNFSSIFGNPTSVDSGTPGADTHTWSSDPEFSTADPSTRNMLTMALQIGMLSSVQVSDNHVRNATGAISPTMSFKMSVGEPIRVTQDIIWGIEPDSSPTIDTSIGDNNNFTPYVFANAQIELNGSVVATVQDFDLNINSNAQLLWEFGSPDATNAWRKILEMTGKLNLTVQDGSFFDLVRARSPQATMTVTITNGLVDANLKQIVMSFSNVGLGKYNNTGIEPGELVLQDVDFQCKRVVIVATNNEAQQPDSN